MERTKLNHFAIFVSVITFFLIIAGALVTSTGSGLAVPDWPLSFGKFFPAMTGGVLFEHSHRMIAGTVAILTVLLSIFLWFKEERKWVAWIGSGAVGVVVLQALLGGVTVLYGLPPFISIAHAVLAQTFFCLMVSIALLTSPSWNRKEPPALEKQTHLKTLFSLALIANILIYIQLILGAGFRHGLGIKPIQWHMLNAFFILLISTFVIGKIFKQFKKEKGLFISAWVLISLLLFQNLLGIETILPMFGIPIYFDRRWISALHVACGALIFAVSIKITLESFHLKNL
ncbi:MAG: hypothetical protein A3I11_06750 [Elusimicrobia bacterium RIFCSPLOWO2_02_FULL_39_32]|nr:MAG: hypothetical protein A2034_04780 [Elusimicrobia bacterium GWA2_38_7]OGR81103.1 MAG: hypothetical protein A3B80_03605 [Elusimicrobia bacterium RIFCSPHIGHO2_02_FULL_39_36]OGR90991.1 MAG: hypothetical protein A3I11_06750 [Elusimicrobia bacterium RIFCSPLOWO2_02_FULL_39_32]OGR98299.1 MAG: hypothetical protein A3G85_07515 [Elusimicrobia bacterium RIFCSPLOWO2_12_FULL_39_28]